MTPARAASPAPAAQMIEITRFTSIPDAEASAGLSAMARDALPIRVILSQATVRTRNRMAMPAPTRALGVTTIGPSTIPACPEYSAYWRVFPPKTNR